MAASLNFNRLDLVLSFVFDDGTGTGKMQTKRITLSKVRADITADEILQVATAFESLSSNEFIGVERVQRDSVL
ncbi:DUF1659 domain-containing protein (plasmid) [Psychrobacillus glaciei]|uniref:DUF1659 domain-containing protein n=1 Tax=Psychrobacillus glaciei TaxID=2283160 RepID=A0A5J6STT2_9BACI|nr:DUF1659 domain-containing protein [Psychrobacillus glaciei]QFG01291.1 DUF1659 domain-containing protein [Psychrobacillus glaciei]